ncbi:hypothetical protein BG20_I2531, partial [Candidatus Nitrosarchaeum limnium BG20]
IPANRIVLSISITAIQKRFSGRIFSNFCILLIYKKN